MNEIFLVEGVLYFVWFWGSSLILRYFNYALPIRFKNCFRYFSIHIAARYGLCGCP